MKINKNFILAFFAFLVCNIAFSQAKKPTIMVIPSENWCVKNGYTMDFDNQGTKIRVPDYRRAFQENSDLLLVISKINNLMADRGFPLKNLESAIKTQESETAENNLTSSKSGAGVVELPIDRLKRTAKADIIMQLTWTINSTGPKKSVSFILSAFDAYTDKQVAGAEDAGTPSFSVEVPVLLEEAVIKHLDMFNSRLQKHFDDMFENGREIIVRIKKFSSWPDDLEKEYNGKELSAIIEDWMSQNTLKGRFNTTDSTESMMLLEQVRIPLYDAKGKATDARGFLKGLQDFLKSAPYNIPNKLTTKGLGQAVIVLGEK
jgi:hypothetical protein